MELTINSTGARYQLH